MGSIRLEKVEKWFGDTQVIKGIDLEINDGELVVFVGPSGCGKSTLLRMISGLEETSRGAIYLDGQDVTHKVPSERELSMVFQSYALYPHLSVEENMGFALKTAGHPKAEIAEKVHDVADILKLTEYLDRRPKDLSGGQRQRVAIGRAIVRKPKGFLFDEPLSNLDAALRVDMRLEIARLHHTLKTTMVYVTHDQVEAMTLADRIVVLRDGIVEQVGTPRELYECPNSHFVAQFIGSPKMNVLTCKVASGQYQVTEGRNGTAAPAGATSVGTRPEHITLGAAGTGEMDGTVEVIEYLGSDTFVLVNCDPIGSVTVRLAGATDLDIGDHVGLTSAPDRVLFFNDAGRAI